MRASTPTVTALARSRSVAAGLAALGLALIASLLASSPARGAGLSFVTEWGSPGSGEGQFDNPSYVATDAGGNVYVTENNANDRVQKFTSRGEFITKWGSLGGANGQFVDPQGIATDSAGNVYVADLFNFRVQKFSPSGAFITAWGTEGSGPGQFDGPYGVATDAADNVYVTDLGFGSMRVQKFTSAGAFITQWGSQGSGDGQFAGPSGIATDAEGNVYVADAGNNRVQKFNAGGAFIAKWGSTGSGEGQFNQPVDVATNSAGSVFVSDVDNHRIQQFTSAGDFVSEFGERGSGPGEFGNFGPLGLATNSTGDVYATDRSNERIELFSSIPLLGKSVNVETVKGKVKTKCKGETGFSKLEVARQIPVGCRVDTRKGTVRMTSAKDTSGATQTGEFWQGRFRVTQKVSKAPATVLELDGPVRCGKGRAAAAAGRKKGKKKRGKGRKLWGKGKGKFKTKGKKGSANVRGTTWLVADRCNRTTLFKVRQGKVKVRDKRQEEDRHGAEGRPVRRGEALGGCGCPAGGAPPCSRSGALPPRSRCSPTRQTSVAGWSSTRSTRDSRSAVPTTRRTIWSSSRSTTTPSAPSASSGPSRAPCTPTRSGGCRMREPGRSATTSSSPSRPRPTRTTR